MIESAATSSLHEARAECNYRYTQTSERNVTALAQIQQASYDSGHCIDYPYFVPETSMALELAATQAGYPRDVTDAWHGRAADGIKAAREIFPNLNSRRATAALHFMHARSLIHRMIAHHRDEELAAAAAAASQAAIHTTFMLRQPIYSHDIMYTEALRQHCLFLAYAPEPETEEAIEILDDMQAYNETLHNRRMPIYYDERSKPNAEDIDRRVRKIVIDQARNDDRHPSFARERAARARQFLD